MAKATLLKMATIGAKINTSDFSDRGAGGVIGIQDRDIKDKNFEDGSEMQQESKMTH